MSDQNTPSTGSPSALSLFETFEVPMSDVVSQPVGHSLSQYAPADEPEQQAEAAPVCETVETESPVTANVEGPDEAVEDTTEVNSQPEPAEAFISIESPAVVETSDSVETSEPSANDTNADEPAEVIASEQPESGFRALDLSSEIQQSIESAGYDTPTDIQAQIIPHVLAGRDVLAQSQTGTGKTAAFALPILSRVDVKRRKPQVLVLAPTRELAMQVADSFSTYASCLPGFDVAAIYGGQGYDTQLRQLRRGVPVVVGTPGRVIDHIKRRTLDLSEIDCLVLDEADEMLNMGFLDDVQFVLEQTPENRQVALFSATLPKPIQNIAQRYLNDPVRITIQRKTMTAEAIRQRAVFVAPRDKSDALSRFLEVEETDGVIVFTKTREATVTVAERLNRDGFSAVALNGDMPQNVRERTIDQLKSGRLDILVATDVAARGLDVSRVSHVFNYDVPQDTESYIHRIGRTGRAGRKGEAIIFLSNSQRYKLRQIERVTKQSIEVVRTPSADDINATRVQRFKQRISETADSQDLTLFTKVLEEYATESGKPFEVIAAALAELGQQGRPFFVQERPRRDKRDRFQDRDDRRNQDGHRRRDRFERNGGSGNERPGRGEKRGNRRAGRLEAGMDRYRIEVGHDDGVKPGNIVGAVANEGGIDGEYIGPINIYDSYSTIDLPEGMPREIHQTLQSVRVAGKQLRLRRASESDNHGKSSDRRGTRNSKPRFGKRNKGGKPNRAPGRGKKRKERNGKS